MSKLTLDGAIKHCLEVAEENVAQADRIDMQSMSDTLDKYATGCRECAAAHIQLAEWLTELKEAKDIIRVCNRVLGYLLESEIESTSTRHEVETLLKNITKYLSGDGDNDNR